MFESANLDRFLRAIASQWSIPFMPNTYFFSYNHSGHKIVQLFIRRFRKHMSDFRLLARSSSYDWTEQFLHFFWLWFPRKLRLLLGKSVSSDWLDSKNVWWYQVARVLAEPFWILFLQSGLRQKINLAQLSSFPKLDNISETFLRLLSSIQL